MILFTKVKTHMAKYDTISRHLIQTYPDDFIRFTLGRDDVEVRAILDTEQPTVETRQTDSLIRVRIDGKDVVVHTEFQTTDSTDTPMEHRISSYIGRAIEKYGLPVYSIVIYLRPDAGRRDTGLYIQEHPDFQVVVRYRVIRLSEIDGQSIIEGGPQGLLPFAPLMKPPVGMASEEWLRQCILKTDATSLAHSTKVNFLGGLAVLSGLVYEPSTITSIISQEGLMDAIMRESSFAQYIKQVGIQESIQEVLEVRFDPDAANQFAADIRAIDDLQRLKQLHRSAVQVDDLAAFQDMLDAE